MKNKYWFAAFSSALIFAGCSDDLNIGTNTPVIDNTSGPVVVNSAQDALPNMVLVKFQEAYGDLIEQTTMQARAMNTSSRSGILSFDKFMQDADVVSFTRLFPAGKYEKRTRESGMHLWYKVCFKSQKDMVEVERELKSIKELQVVQFNVPVHPVEPTSISIVDDIIASRSLAKEGGSKPNDKLFGDQWSLYYNAAESGKLFGKFEEVAHINALGAWSKQQSANDVVVAVIDQGVNYNHPDLKNNMWVNEDEVAGNEDKDGNGYVGDVHGYDFAKGSKEIAMGSHGTHVAGIIAAGTNNTVGIAGIAGGTDGSNGARIMTCSIFDETGSGGGSASVAEAVKYAADNGAVICQNSWGYTNPEIDWENSMTYSAEKQAYEYFIKYAGKDAEGKVVGALDGGLVVFAAGNYGHMYGDTKMYPAAHPSFIAVASVGADYNPAYYTEYGDWVDISAPGGDQLFASNELADSTSYTAEDDMHGGILSTYFVDGEMNNFKYAYMQGTSQACPQVSGIAALAAQYAKSKNVTLRSTELREMLLSSTTPIDHHFKGEKSDNGRYTGQAFKLNMEDYKGKMGTGLIDASLVLANVEKRVGAPADHQQPSPVAKEQLAEKEIKPGSLTLDLTVGKDIDMYRLYISDAEIQVNENGDIVYDDHLVGPQYVYSKNAVNGKLTCSFNNLRAQTVYNVAVVAVDKYCYQSKTAVFSYTTAEPAAGPAVKDLKALEVGAAKIKLQWTETGDCINDPYVSYVITCAEDKDFKVGVITKTVLAKKVGEQMTTTVEGLKPNTAYYVKVQAWDQFTIQSEVAQLAKPVTTKANQMPVVNPNKVELQTLQYWETKTLTFKVSDPDGDKWTAALEDKNKCWEVSSNDKEVTLVFKAASDFSGEATATLTVTDSNDGKAIVKVPYKVVANVAPEQTRRFKDLYLTTWNEPTQFKLDDYFKDRNNEKLKYSFSLQGESVDLSIKDGVLNIAGKKNGLTEVTLVAADAGGKSVDTKFEVMVRKSDSALDIYPNPVGPTMNVRMGQEVKGNINVSIYTSTGTYVMDATAKIDPFKPAQIDVASLKSGSYVVEVTYNEQTYKQNIVKL